MGGGGLIFFPSSEFQRGARLLPSAATEVTLRQLVRDLFVESRAKQDSRGRRRGNFAHGERDDDAVLVTEKSA